MTLFNDSDGFFADEDRLNIKAPRMSQSCKKADNASCDAIPDDLRCSIRDSVNVVGNCTIEECHNPALYRSPSAVTQQMFCVEHAENAFKTFPDLIDAGGIP